MKGITTKTKILKCDVCFENFVVHATRAGTKRCSQKCKKIFSKRYRSSYRSRPEWISKARDHDLKKKYGISLAQYYSLLESQDGSCAICKRKFTGVKNQRFFHVDHRHESDQIRGILCSLCNTGLGCFEDCPETLDKAIKYLLIAEEIQSES